ncbi:MAG: histidine phosphatase family protein [Vicinamibacterales bacterium]
MISTLSRTVTRHLNKKHTAGRAAVVVAVALALSSCASAPPDLPPTIPSDRGETTVYIVRHAEKATNDPRDPDLSTKGFARADSLATQLREAGINYIITTQLKRTIQTAGPLARKRHITPEVVPVGTSTTIHVDSVVAAVKRRPGATILIVGHSNTIGPIAQALGGDKIGSVCDNEYSNLIVLSIPRAQRTRMLVQTYGLRDEPGDGTCKPLMGPGRKKAPSR